MAFDDRFDSPLVFETLDRAAKLVLEKHQVPPSGTVIGYGREMAPGSACRALYVSYPTVYPDNFDLFEGTSPPTFIPWLIPILADEAEFVRRNGWGAFESELLRRQPDLFNLSRASMFGASGAKEQ